MKKAEIRKVYNVLGEVFYYFQLRDEDNNVIVTSHSQQSKEVCISVIGKHFSDFGVVDNTNNTYNF